jgi:short subunit dehydrogenase-like uncharacterized protein
LAKEYPQLSWAIAGRSLAKVTEVKTSLNLKKSVLVIVADITDVASLITMTQQTTVVLSTAGPFDRIGTPIVEACIKTGTHYCDTTGEPQWVRKLVDAYAEEATRQKVKIVNCCGFDCIPSDLGAQMMSEAMSVRNISPRHVRFIMGDSVSGASGGTIISVVNIFATVPYLELQDMFQPHYLHPARCTWDRPRSSLLSNLLVWCQVSYDWVYGCWTMPYVMQTVNIPIVNRSKVLLKNLKTKNSSEAGDYEYTECMKTPGAGPIGAFIGVIVLPIVATLLMIPFLRNFLLKYVLPKSGEGPSDEVLNNGNFHVMLHGTGVDRSTGKSVTLKGRIDAQNGDPGYR